MRIFFSFVFFEFAAMDPAVVFIIPPQSPTRLKGMADRGHSLEEVSDERTECPASGRGSSGSCAVERNCCGGGVQRRRLARIGAAVGGARGAVAALSVRLRLVSAVGLRFRIPASV